MHTKFGYFEVRPSMIFSGRREGTSDTKVRRMLHASWICPDIDSGGTPYFQNARIVYLVRFSQLDFTTACSAVGHSANYSVSFISLGVQMHITIKDSQQSLPISGQ